MRVMYDVADIANSYGASKFYEQVREATLTILEASGLELNEFTIRDFYQRFALAYIIGVKSRNPQMMADLLTEETFDPLGDWLDVVDDSGLTILNTEPPEKTLGLDLNTLVITDQFAQSETCDTTFLTGEGTPEQHSLAFSAAFNLLRDELTLMTGLAGLVDSLYPGQYVTYIGDSFNDIVLVCE